MSWLRGVYKHGISAAKQYRKQDLCFGRLGSSLLQRRTASIYEPDGLDYIPDIPEYETVNFKLQGYDFTVLESYGKFLHRLFLSFDYAVDSFPVPASSFDIQTLKPNSSVVLDKYQLNIYERVVQVQNFPSTTGSIMLQFVQEHLPEGVTLIVKEPDEVEDDQRYIPDVILNNLKDQMESIHQAIEEKKKK